MHLNEIGLRMCDGLLWTCSCTLGLKKDGKFIDYLTDY